MEQLIGKIPIAIERSHDEIKFTMLDDTFFVLRHEQDCCEDVVLEDIDGDINDLLDEPITISSERYEEDETASESATWSFYHIGNRKMTLVIRFYGSSNGYYSETAELYQVDINGKHIY